MLGEDLVALGHAHDYSPFSTFAIVYLIRSVRLTLVFVELSPGCGTLPATIWVNKLPSRNKTGLDSPQNPDKVLPPPAETIPACGWSSTDIVV